MMSSSAANPVLVQETGPADRQHFAQAVRNGLEMRPRHLPCQFIYDARGSALFERICQLPAYYPPEAEREIIARHADDIARACRSPCELVELGSGSAEKTDPLIAALRRRQGAVHYYPIDVSRSALEDSAQRMMLDHPDLSIHALVGDYESALSQLPRIGPVRLFAWLGSSIGNLDRKAAAAFLARLPLRPHDRAFIGIDLRKEPATLENAYDDSEGITAEFIANVLVRVNRELAGEFELSAFDYHAEYDRKIGKVAMSLVSTRQQTVAIGALNRSFTFAQGEAIHVEDSYKYSEAEIGELAERSGLRIEACFFDSRRRFCNVLLAPRPA